MTTISPDIEPLLDRLKQGDQAALAELFALYRGPLERMIDFRLDPRLNGRVAASDVLQEAYLDAIKRVPHYFKKPEMPFGLWLRLIAGQRLVDVHRQHLGAQMRSVGQEISLPQGAWAGASSACLAAHLIGQFTPASQNLERMELAAKVEAALASLEPIDREVLSLRHFEELSNGDTAAILGIEKSAASKRYLRALERLRTALAAIPGLLDEEPQ